MSLSGVLLITLHGTDTFSRKKLSYRRDNARCLKRPFKVTEGHHVIRNEDVTVYILDQSEDDRSLQIMKEKSCDLRIVD